jgi:DNA repair protein RecO (recombination protein O)
MLYKTKGIVLHQVKYSETSIITKIFTEELGLQSYLVKGARSRKSKLKANLFRALSLLNLVVYHKDNKNIHHLKEASPAYNYASIPVDINKGAIAMFLSEILYKSIREQETNKPMFDFIFSSLVHLDQQSKAYVNFHIFFMVHFSRFLGFFPNDNFNKTNASIFDLEEGLFTDRVPLHSNYIPFPLSHTFYEFILSSEKNYHELRISHSRRKILLDKLIDYYRLHLPLFKDIKSHLVLEAVLK